MHEAQTERKRHSTLNTRLSLDGFPFILQDGSGYIDENELDALLKDLCEKNKKVKL